MIPFQCIRCRIVTNNAFVLYAEEFIGFVWALEKMAIPRATILDLIEFAVPDDVEEPDDVNLRQSVCIELPMCRRCGKKFDTDVYSAAELRAMWNDPARDTIPGVYIRRRGLADAQEAWDRLQEMDKPTHHMQVERGAPVAGTGKSVIDGLPKDIKRLVGPAVKDGWSPAIDGTGHVRFTRGEKSFTVPSTPSSNRTLTNIRLNMRQVGALEKS